MATDRFLVPRGDGAASFAGGITKLVYHVYPYRDSPTSRWPGYHNFGPAGFSNAWGPREPYWADAKLYNDYFARNQQVLTQGDAKVDIAVYMQNYLYPEPWSIAGGFRIWRDTKLQEVGYTRDYLNPDMLDLPNAVVRSGRLAPDGPAYRAFVIDSEQEPRTDPLKTSMPVNVARKILGFARAGLTVVVVGTPPDRTPGNTPADDAMLQSAIRDLLAEKSVRRVPHQADVPAMLRSLGIRPAAEPASPSPMLSVRRTDPATRTDYYFLYNQGVVTPKGEPENLFEPATGEPLDREVSLEGQGRPYLLDAWSGEITPIVNYTANRDRVTLRVKLSPDNGLLIAISESARRFGVTAPAPQVTRTDAMDAVAAGGTAAIRANKPGTYTTVLGNGRTVRTPIGEVPAPIDLTGATWELAAEDWQPANPYETTFGPAAAQTLKSPVKVLLTGLKAWPDIPSLQHASGTGAYTTTFELPSGWTASHGAILNLGEVFDTFTLAINDKAVAIDQISAQADIGPYLKPGRNTIAVRVATTLNNRLANLDEAVAQRGLIQRYGLIGPVVVTPYRRAAIPR